MRSQLVLIAAAAIVWSSACGTTATPSPALTAPSATTSATPSATQSAAPTVTASIDRDVVYFARDRLSPLAGHVDGAGAGTTSEDRVLSRMRALFGAIAPPGLFNVTSNAKARPSSVSITGDLATVDFTVPGGDWGTAGSAGTRAFIQQLVYTATEEPGIRRALFLENGGQAIIGGEGVVVDHPATRENVAGYEFPGSIEETALVAEPRETPLAVTAEMTSEGAGHEFTRLVVTADATGAEAKVPLGFTARVVPNDERAAPAFAKWRLIVEVPSARTSREGLFIIDKTPARSLRSTAFEDSVRYELGLDDLRPWRVAAMYAPLRIVIDIGGDPQAVSPNIALYTPSFGAKVRSGYSVTGMVRAFEAQYEYRIRNSHGDVVADGFGMASIGTSSLWGVYALPLPKVAPGPATVEILLRSPKDGEISETVFSSVVILPEPGP